MPRPTLPRPGSSSSASTISTVDRYGAPDYPAHHALLEAGVIIVEGLDLSEVEPGEYDMACLPLRVADGDGAPARVILRSRG